MTQPSEPHSLVANYQSHSAAASAVKTLQAAGVEMKQLSIVFSVLAEGSPSFIEHARSILGSTGPSELTVQKRSNYVTRETVLKLLSDTEMAKLSKAESAVRLSGGEEYLNLQALSEGVLLADGVPVPMALVLPRTAVHETTSGQILAQLDGSNNEA